MQNDNINPLKCPPLQPAELKDSHSYEDIARVVVTQHGVYGLARNGGWIKFQPIASISGGRDAGE